MINGDTTFSVQVSRLTNVETKRDIEGTWFPNVHKYRQVLSIVNMHPLPGDKSMSKALAKSQIARPQLLL